MSSGKYSKYSEEWMELYRKGLSCYNISRRYGCSKSPVYDIIKNSGLMRPSKNMYRFKYSTSDAYFDIIDSEEKAYFLGLLLSDGCIYRPERATQRVQLQITALDAYIVDRLATILNRKSYRCPARGRTKESSCLTVTSDHMVEVLRSYGFTDRKSTDNHESKVFDHVPPELMHHFIRGIFDGDGCISVRNKTGKISGLYMMGNLQDMLRISNVLSCIGCTIVAPRSHSSIYRLSWYSKEDITIIMNYLYCDATIYLDRKKNRFDTFINTK